MKKLIHCSFVLVLLLSACSNEKETVTADNEELSSPISEALPGESLEEAGLKPLSEGAERYFGEFVAQNNKDFKVVLRKHPTRENMLAWNAYIAGKTPGMATFWYDDSQQQVSNRFAKVQPKFTIMKLNDEGNMLTEIAIDLDKDTSDTTVFMRMQ